MSDQRVDELPRLPRENMREWLGDMLIGAQGQIPGPLFSMAILFINKAKDAQLQALADVIENDVLPRMASSPDKLGALRQMMIDLDAPQMLIDAVMSYAKQLTD